MLMLPLEKIDWLVHPEKMADILWDTGPSFCYILEAQVRETFGMSVRKDIRKGWKDFCYRIVIGVKMVDGQNFGGENQLKEAFPLLFKQASSKKA